jgi:hypothetical protein
MNESFTDLALKERGDNKKLSLLTAKEVDYVSSRLRAAAGVSKAASGSQGAATRRNCRRAGGRRVGRSKATNPKLEGLEISDRVIRECFKLVAKSDGTEVLFRKRTRKRKTAYVPFIAIEQLGDRLQLGHEELGHCGYEQLFDWVRGRVSWLQGHGYSGRQAGWTGDGSPPPHRLPNQHSLPAAPSPPPIQMADKAQTDMGLDSEGRKWFAEGLTGVTREIVRTFTFRCPTCAYKRDTKASARPATTAIVVRSVFELVQVGVGLEVRALLQIRHYKCLRAGTGFTSGLPPPPCPPSPAAAD